MCWMRLNSSMSDWSGADRTCRGRAALNSPRTSQPPGARALEVVAFLDEQVEPVEERVDVGARQAVVEHRHGQVRVDLGDPPGRDPRLRGAEIVHARAEPVEVGQFQPVEVRDFEMAAQVFLREGDRGFATDRQPDDADALAPEDILLHAARAAPRWCRGR